MPDKKIKLKEWLYLLLNYSSAIYFITRHLLKKEVDKSARKPHILDVGGRKSPYTSALKIELTISDIQRETDIQNSLHLGFTKNIVEEIKQRSNVKEVVFDDMTKTAFAAESFDGIVTIEVIEHVPQDEAFVANISKVLKPGGFLILSTPNGDHCPCGKNPDHIRHYKKAELEKLLKRHFSNVNVYYAVPDTKAYKYSVPSFLRTNIFRAVFIIANGFISAMQTMFTYRNNNINKNHLLAYCNK